MSEKLSPKPEDVYGDYKKAYQAMVNMQVAAGERVRYQLNKPIEEYTDEELQSLYDEADSNIVQRGKALKDAEHRHDKTIETATHYYEENTPALTEEAQSWDRNRKK